MDRTATGTSSLSIESVTPSIPSFKDFRYPVGSPGYVRVRAERSCRHHRQRMAVRPARPNWHGGCRGRRPDRCPWPSGAGLDPHRSTAVWWASNPAWLRRIGREHQLEMSEPHMVLEGTVMELRPAPSHVDMVATRRFVPTSRPNDQYLTHAVWRGFSAQDRAADRSWLARPITSPDRRAHHPRVQRSGETNASSCSDRSFAESR